MGTRVQLSGIDEPKTSAFTLWKMGWPFFAVGSVVLGGVALFAAKKLMPPDPYAGEDDPFTTPEFLAAHCA